MSVKYRKGNLVDAYLAKEVDAIAHVCNNRGKFASSGVAKEIRQRLPQAYSAYLRDDMHLLGTNSQVGEEIFNMVAQDGYGYDGKRYLDYGALTCCLIMVMEELEQPRIELSDDCPPKKLGLPFGMGAVRAGGDREIVEEIVKALAEMYNVDIIWYKLEG